MKMKKKLLSIVLTICMILTLLPTFALAEATTATAITNAEGLRNALTTGGSYTLSNDITLGDWASVTVSSDFTLDGNGHTLSGMNVTEAAGTGNSGTSGSDYSLYHAGLIGNANANVTLSNLKVSGATVAPSKVTGAPNDYVYKNGLSSAAVLIGTSSGVKTIALNNVSVTNSTVAGVTKLGVFVGQNNSTLNITNCEISGCTVTGEYNYAPVAGYTAKTAVITASGLTLSGNSMTFQKVDTDFQAYISADGTANVVTPAYAVETDNKSLWATSSDYYVIDDGSTASTVTGYTDGYTMKRVAVTVADSFVCSIGNTYYPTLAAAVTAAVNGDTIKLLADVTLAETITISSGKSITLDLNGYTISKDSMPFKLTHGTLNLIGTGTIKETADDQYSPVLIKGSTNAADTNYSVLNVGKDVTLKGWAGVFIDQNAKGAPYAYGVKVTIDGTLVSPGDVSHTTAGHAIYINGNIKHTENCPTITINQTASLSSNGDICYAAGYAKWTINGGRFSGVSGIELKAGEITINDGKFEATAASTTHVANGNGTSTSGYVLAVVDNAGYGMPRNVTINGGSFTGPVAIVDDDTDVAKNIAKLSITGGYFTSDPSAYVVSGKVVGTSDKTGYTYMVKAVEANVKVDVGETVANPAPSEAPGYSELENVTVAPDASDTGLTAAGGDRKSVV